MSIINRLHGKEQSDGQLDAEIQHLNNSIQRYEQKRESLSAVKDFTVEKESEYEYVDQQLYMALRSREKLLKLRDKRSARLAKEVLRSRENTVK